MTFARPRWSDRWNRLLGHPVERDLSRYREPTARVRELGRALAALSDAALGERARALRGRVRGGAAPDALLPELFALACEAAERSLGLRAYDEQVVAGIALAEGGVVEMQTGEGKTLAAVAPAALHALAGAGVHVLTFNDYLARRDAAWMGPVYRLLGLEVAALDQGMPAAERRRAYAADVTYLTAKEAGFDFLRDHLCLEPGERVQRPCHFALVDEADSILVDEARIPLVIASQAQPPQAGAARAAALVRLLRPGADFDTDEHGHNIALTDRGARRIEEAAGCGSLYELDNLELLTDLRNALHAEHLLERDVDYVVRGGRVELVDDFTGRVAERRQWPDGLQAAIEAKENLEPQQEGRILGSVTMQHFIASYPRLSGMTGTAQAAAEELAAFYGLRVVAIPTHAPCRRVDHPDVVFTHREAKRAALVEEIAGAHAAGRPVLVGTSSVRESEELAADLERAGVPVRVLNAKNDAREAEIVAQAGAPGAVTISTNMAGRGTDIRLGGPDEARREAVAAAGGLYVIGTNRHEATRVDLQLRGRAGRQGDPGATRFFVSLEDPLIETYGAFELIPPEHRPQRQPGPVGDPVVAQEIARAQRIVEGACFEMRRQQWCYSKALEAQRQPLQEWRRAVLEGAEPLELLASRRPERWAAARARFGDDECLRLERRLTLLAVDRCWSDHLALARRIRDGIHVAAFAGKEPLAEYTRELIAAFGEFQRLVEDEIVARFEAVPLDERGIDWRQQALLGPSSTWTYLVHETPFGSNPMRGLLARRGPALAAATLAAPFFVAWSLVLRYQTWRRRRASARAQSDSS